MNDQVSWIIKLNIVEGKTDEAEALIKKMINTTKENEPGALNYEWYFNEDNSACHVFERYKNSDAVLTHLKNLGENFMDQFMSCFEPTDLTVYGNPNRKARQALDDLGARYLSFTDGFSR